MGNSISTREYEGIYCNQLPNIVNVLHYTDLILYDIWSVSMITDNMTAELGLFQLNAFLVILISLFMLLFLHFTMYELKSVIILPFIHYAWNSLCNLPIIFHSFRSRLTSHLFPDFSKYILNYLNLSLEVCSAVCFEECHAFLIVSTRFNVWWTSNH